MYKEEAGDQNRTAFYKQMQHVNDKIVVFKHMFY
jgi:hypothetical protein